MTKRTIDDLIASIQKSIAEHPEFAANVDQAGAALREMFVSHGVAWNDDTLSGFIVGLLINPNNRDAMATCAASMIGPR